MSIGGAMSILSVIADMGIGGILLLVVVVIGLGFGLGVIACWLFFQHNVRSWKGKKVPL